MSTISGTTGGDTLVGTEGSDTISGGPGKDSLTGGGGNDTLFGGTDADTLSGGDGIDLLWGDEGQDVIAGDGGGDTVYGGGGNDSIDGGEGDDVLYGGAGHDQLKGGLGNDTLSGGAGSDKLYGGEGSDYFTAGPGDLVEGGSGAHDILDPRSSGRFRVEYDPLDGTRGSIKYLDRNDAVTGTLSFSGIEQVIVCFTAGALIQTETGRRPVESIRSGERVLTRDSGFQEVAWAGAKTVQASQMLLDPSLRPVLVRKDALGPGLPDQDMLMSRQHRILFAEPRAELLFGEPEVLVPACYLIGQCGIDEVVRPAVTYVHFMFERHEIVMGDGLWSESFQPGARSLAGVHDDARAELLRIFPELGRPSSAPAFDAARSTLKTHESRVLLAS